jgi:RNA polymerase sigma-70 factor (ECF subfamily)
VGSQVADRAFHEDSETDDAELMLKIQQRDERAFRELLNRYLAPLNRFAVRMLGNSHDAEDLVQETFLRAWKNAHQWQPHQGKLTTWLHAITHHLCIDFHRRDRSALHTEVSAQLQSSDTPEKHLAAANKGRAVTAALVQLPERQKSAIILCHYQGLSNRDAAAVIGVSVDALESLMARGRRTLRKELASLSAQEE